MLDRYRELIFVNFLNFLFFSLNSRIDVEIFFSKIEKDYLEGYLYKLG